MIAEASRRPETRPALRYEVIRDARRFAAIKELWSEILDEAAIELPFLTFEWLAEAWQRFDSNSDPFVIAAWDGVRLAGAIPLLRRRVVSHGVPLAQIEFLGAAESFPQALPFRNAEFEQVLAGLFDCATSMRWDVMKLCFMPSNTWSGHGIRRWAEERGLPTETEPSISTPILEVRGSWDEFLTGKGRHFRQKVRKKVRKFLGVPGAAVNQYTSAENLVAGLDKMFLIAEKSWQGKAGFGVMRSPRFFRGFSVAAAHRGWLVLSIAEMAGKPVAFQYDLRYHDCIYALAAGFDASAEHFSPGLVLRAMTLEKAVEEGYRRFNFLAGNHPWKREWTDESVAYEDLYVFNRTAASWLFRSVYFKVRPWMRRVFCYMNHRGEVKGTG